MNEIEYKKAMNVPDSAPVRVNMTSKDRLMTQIQWTKDKNISKCEDQIISHLEERKKITKDDLLSK